ncbi:pyridoxal phosphate-dependent aminotransferase [Desulfovibrio sp. OttesenSCG-928-O18]|nr:pyridoxal phosphate-dependent aminotransferase [Desulfovibrio sp. OttesenSCG-928-O18]
MISRPALSKRVLGMTPSATVELAGRIESLKKQGVSVLSFSLGEPDFPTPENICAAACSAIKEGHTKYTAAAGILELREAICEKLRKDNGLEYAPNEITVTAGAKQALYNALMAICDKGDEVIVPSPCWVSYVEMIKLAEAAPVIVPTLEEEGFQLNMDTLKAALTPRTRAVLINSPNNPTGAVYGKETLLALGKLAVEKGFYIITDEIYEKLIYDGEKHYSIGALCPECREWCITVNGFSKAYSMTGWRVGYAAGPAAVIKGMNGLQGHMTSNASTPAQKACVEALKGPQDSVGVMREAFAERRGYILERLNAMPGIRCADVKGAFYVMPNVSALYGKSYEGKRITDSLALSELFIDQVQVAVVPGVAFEAPNNIRISYASSMDAIREGMDRIERCLARLA